MKRITIATIQPPVFNEKSTAANNLMIEAGFSCLDAALKAGALFCCLPEYFNVFGVADQHMQKQASNAGDLLDRVQQLAAQHQAYIILPVLMQNLDHFLNRAFLVGPAGTVMGYYDKTHPTLGEKDRLAVKPGNEIPLFETEHGRVAIVICYDIYFPELFAILALQKPDLIFFPSLQRSDHEMASEAILKTRAMDTKAYVVRSSYGCPADLPWKAGMMFGQSCIVHPDGAILGNAGHYEGLALAHTPVPFNWSRQRCGGYPAMDVSAFLEEDRRPDLYGDPGT